MTPPEWLPLTAGGFRDTTRIAAGDPDLWAAIFEANRDAVLGRARPRSPTGWPSSDGCSKPATGPGSCGGWPKAKKVRDALGS